MSAVPDRPNAQAYYANSIPFAAGLQEDTLFSLSRYAVDLAPQSLRVAMRIASTIIRSRIFSDIFCSLFAVNGSNHVETGELQAVLERNGLFTIDLIRHGPYLVARGVTIREYDPWILHLNPVLLLEAKIREDEYQLINLSAFNVDKDMIFEVDAFDDNGDPNPSRYFNSLIYDRQMKEYIERQGSATPKKRKVRTAAAPVVPSSAAESGSEEQQLVQDPMARGGGGKKDKSLSSSSGGGRIATTGGAYHKERVKKEGTPPAASLPPPPPRLSVAPLPTVETPSDLTPFQKLVLAETVLLIHKSSHLLNGALSDALTDEKKTPPKCVRRLNEGTASQRDMYLSDIGHIIEYYLFGYAIQHQIDEQMPNPFAIHEILGSDRETDPEGLILTLQSGGDLLRAVDNGGVGFVPTTSNLRLQPTSSRATKRSKAAQVTLGQYYTATKSQPYIFPLDRGFE